MGAQQTYEWAMRYRDMVERAAPIAGFAKSSVQTFVVPESLGQASKSDTAHADAWDAGVSPGSYRH
jgi:homoserine O-acetyltransferase